jgi:hypothetical protein
MGLRRIRNNPGRLFPHNSIKRSNLPKPKGKTAHSGNKGYASVLKYDIKRFYLYWLEFMGIVQRDLATKEDFKAAQL